MLSTGIQNITAVRKLYGTLCNVNINKINRVQNTLYFLYFSRILDDVEMYEKQSPFKLSDFIVMSNFLNLFIYKAVVGNLLGKYIVLYSFLLEIGYLITGYPKLSNHLINQTYYSSKCQGPTPL